MRITVVGAGIAGLTCALRLRDAGHAVEIVAAEVGEATTSAIAAAVWYPVPALARVPAMHLAAGYADGFALTVPVIDMSAHLPWLLRQGSARGVPLRRAHLPDLGTAAPDADVVVNCAGLGARRLLGDTAPPP